MNNKIKDIFYFRESLLQSVIADCVTFGFIIGGFFLNRYFLGDKWYIDLFFISCFFISLSAQSKAKRFTNLKEFKEFVSKL